MPNSNVVSRFVGANSPAQGATVIPSLLLTTNTETLFTNQSGGVAVIAPQPVGQLAAATTAPSFGSGFDGFAMKVRATFKVSNTVASSTAIINMYANQVGTTITSGNKIASVTSQSLSGTGSANGFLEATLVWDSVSQVLSGLQSGAFGTGSAVSAVALTNTAISIPALANLNFSLTATCGTTGKSVTFAVTEFVVETV